MNPCAVDSELPRPVHRWAAAGTGGRLVRDTRPMRLPHLAGTPGSGPAEQAAFHDLPDRLACRLPELLSC